MEENNVPQPETPVVPVTPETQDLDLAPTMEDLTVEGEQLPNNQISADTVTGAVTSALDSVSISNVNAWIDNNVSQPTYVHMKEFVYSYFRLFLCSISYALSGLMEDFIEKRTRHILLKWVIFSSLMALCFVGLGTLFNVEYLHYIIGLCLASLVIFFNEIKGSISSRRVNNTVTEETIATANTDTEANIDSILPDTNITDNNIDDLLSEITLSDNDVVSEEFDFNNNDNEELAALLNGETTQVIASNAAPYVDSAFYGDDEEEEI